VRIVSVRAGVVMAALAAPGASRGRFRSPCGMPRRMRFLAGKQLASGMQRGPSFGVASEVELDSEGRHPGARRISARVPPGATCPRSLSFS
jgi:hypothetical protein